MRNLFTGLIFLGFTTNAIAEQPLFVNRTPPAELNSDLTEKLELPTSQPKSLTTIPNVDVVFGLKLGVERDKSIPSCENPLALMKTCYSSYPVKRIELARKESPSYIKDRVLYISEIDNKIEKLQFVTNGYKDQVEVLKVLTQKYGKPSFYRDIQSSNAFGRTITVPQAIWDFGDIEVIFLGVTDQINKGGVGFTTRKFREQEKAQLEKRKSQQRTL